MKIIYYINNTAQFVSIKSEDLSDELKSFINECKNTFITGDYFELQDIQNIDGVNHFCNKNYPIKLKKQQIIKEIERMRNVYIRTRKTSV